METIKAGHVTERRHTPERRASLRAVSGHRMNATDWIAMTLLIIGGLNWGAVGLFKFDLVASVFGEMSPLSRIVYVVVGLCALYSIYMSSKVGRQDR